MILKETVIKKWSKVHFTKEGFPHHFCDCGCGKQFGYCFYTRQVVRIEGQLGTRKYSKLIVRRICET